MKSIIISMLLTGFVSAGKLRRRDQTISTNVRDPSLAGFVGTIFSQTTISPGVTYWLTGLGPHATFGNLDNAGDLIYSQSDSFLGGLTPGFVAPYAGIDASNGNLVNRAGALISLNDFGALIASTYNWALRTVENRGTLQMCAKGDIPLVGSAFTLTCTQDCYNYGLIDMEQYFGNQGLAHTWSNVILTPIGLTAPFNVYNNGLVRLNNVMFNNVQNILGTGCWNVGTGSGIFFTDGTLLIQNPSLSGAAWTGQSIYMSSTSGTLHFNLGTYRTNPNFGATIYGFGVGKAIEFIEPINTVSYSNGVLTVTFGLAFVVTGRINLKIGTGYIASQFYTGLNISPETPLGLNAVFYRAAAPAQTIPAICLTNAARCADPLVTVRAAFPASTTSAVIPTLPTSTSSVDIPEPTTTDLPITTSAIPTLTPTTTSLPGTDPAPTSTNVFSSTDPGGELCTCPPPLATVTVTSL